MTGAHIDYDGTCHGLQAITLENKYLMLTILPEVGAKVYSLIHKAADAEILWHHPETKPRIVPPGSAFDDVWCGGWDEQFPNDDPVTHKGVAYPDHGELWCVPWDWQIEEESPDRVTLYLQRAGSALVEKRISLAAGEPFVRMSHRITNTGSAPVDYIWKLHPAFAISPDHRIDLPAGKVIVDPDYSERLCGLSEYDWPYAGQIDMRRVLPETAGTTDFQHVIKLEDGWLAVTDAKRRFGFGLVFPKEIFNAICLFLVYGGWRGLYTALIEPARGYPSRLDIAAGQGTCAVLEPGETVEAEVRGVAYSCVSSVSHINMDGRVMSG